MLDFSKLFADKKTSKSMFSNMVIKGFSLLLNYMYIPLLLSYLGDEKYGLWSTVLSVGVWINHCDIGIGGGLRNILTKEITQHRMDEAKKSISTAYIVLSVLSLGIWLFLTLITVIYGWGNIYNTRVDVEFVMVISYTFICFNFILSLINVTLYALQISEQIAFVSLLSGLTNIIGISVLTRTTEASLIWVSVIYGFSSSLPLIINNVRIFLKYNWAVPKLGLFDKSKVKELTSLGVAFFIMQLGGLMMTSTDNIIISRLFGSSEVTPVEIATKLLGIPKGFYGAMIIPVWGRTAKAITENDMSWLQKMYQKLLLLLGLFGLILLFLLLFFRPITRIWLRKDLIYETGMLLIVALGVYAEMINSSYSSMLNGLGKIKVQMCYAIFQTIVNIPLSLILAVNFKLGVTGIKLATTILFLASGISYLIYSGVYIYKKSGAVSD